MSTVDQVPSLFITTFVHVSSCVFSHERYHWRSIGQPLCGGCCKLNSREKLASLTLSRLLLNINQGQDACQLLEGLQNSVGNLCAGDLLVLRGNENTGAQYSFLIIIYMLGLVVFVGSRGC